MADYKSKFTGAEIDEKLESVFTVPVITNDIMQTFFTGSITDAQYKELIDMLGYSGVCIIEMNTQLPESSEFYISRYFATVARHSGVSAEHTYLATLPFYNTYSSNQKGICQIVDISEYSNNGTHSVSMKMVSFGITVQ